MSKQLSDIVRAMQGLPVMVIGDLMLDTFIYGAVERISPEAPVPILTIGRQETMLGGAGNVLSNLTALGAKPLVYAVIGDDAAGQNLLEKIAALGIDSSGILTDASRPTTLKTRYISGQQQLLRTDFEKIHALDDVLVKILVTAIKKRLPDIGAIVLSDYGKGVLTPELLKSVIEAARAHDVPVLVDPKGRDYMVYRGASIVTPNRKELGEAASGPTPMSDAEVVTAAQRIVETCGIETVIATRSEDGLSVINKKESPLHIKTEARKIFDVSGAGDTVIATLTAALAAKADIENAARLANLAGAIAVSKPGTAPVSAQELLTALRHDSVHLGDSAITDGDAASQQINAWRGQKLKIGFTNGCFDILHKGHVTYLAAARQHCDRLVVALNHDASVRLLKGAGRPVHDEESRAAVLSALVSVDLVILFGAIKAGADNTPAALIERFQPDIYFKGGDYRIETLPEAKIVQTYGGETVLIPFQDGHSTTETIRRASTISR